jgi:hypothetical protein
MTLCFVYPELSALVSTWYIEIRDIWGITQIKCWMELSSLVNRLGSTLSTSVLSFKLIALIVIEKFYYTKKISLISIYLVYPELSALVSA